MPAKRNHPKYNAMVARAIKALGAKDGSSVQAIARYVQSRYNVGSNKNIIRLHVALALKRSMKKGGVKKATKGYRKGKKAKKAPARRARKAAKAGKRRVARRTRRSVKRTVRRRRRQVKKAAKKAAPKRQRRAAKKAGKRRARRAARKSVKKSARKLDNGILRSNIRTKTRRSAAVRAMRNIRRINRL